MSEMVERVAMAVHKTLEFERAFANTNEMVPWGKANDDQKLHARIIARAAIEAMREPTKEMLSDGELSIGGLPATLAVWEAMIDAALQD